MGERPAKWLASDNIKDMDDFGIARIAQHERVVAQRKRGCRQVLRAEGW